jgi:hypothetical protein
MESTPADEKVQAERLRFRQEFLKAHPPRIGFSPEIRGESPDDIDKFDHFELMTAMMESHPILPFEICSLGSDLLDARRALAYHIVIRHLGHARSLIVNANIKNRVGVGVSLRCMCEMYAFANFFNHKDRMEDHRLIELFLFGQSFATGGWYELERVWKQSHSETMPQDAREFFEEMFGLPRLNKFLKPAHEEDEGFSYMYSRYSEYVHPAFARPRDDFEEAIGVVDPPQYGSHQYYYQEMNEGGPAKLILHDIGFGSFCLELFWPIALNIDPHFNKELRPQIVQILKDQGFGKP